MTGPGFNGWARSPSGGRVSGGDVSGADVGRGAALIGPAVASDAAAPNVIAPEETGGAVRSPDMSNGTRLADSPGLSGRAPLATEPTNMAAPATAEPTIRGRRDDGRRRRERRFPDGEAGGAGRGLSGPSSTGASGQRSSRSAIGATGRRSSRAATAGNGRSSSSAVRAGNGRSSSRAVMARNGRGSGTAALATGGRRSSNGGDTGGTAPASRRRPARNAARCCACSAAAGMLRCSGGGATGTAPRRLVVGSIGSGAGGACGSASERPSRRRSSSTDSTDAAAVLDLRGAGFCPSAASRLVSSATVRGTRLSVLSAIDGADASSTSLSPVRRILHPAVVHPPMGQFQVRIYELSVTWKQHQLTCGVQMTVSSPPITPSWQVSVTTSSPRSEACSLAAVTVSWSSPLRVRRMTPCRTIRQLMCGFP